MKMFGRAVCPYCGQKVNLMMTWGLRRRGEYRCQKCRGISNVILSSAVLISAFVAIILSALILMGTMFWLETPTLWSVLAVLAPFLVFYILSLFCVQLKKPVLRRAENTPPQAPRTMPPKTENQSEDLSQTRVL